MNNIEGLNVKIGKYEIILFKGAFWLKNKEGEGILIDEEKLNEIWKILY